MVDIKSMTAFGRGECVGPFGRLVCELQSLNRRHLDCQVQIPVWASCFEIAIRQRLSQYLGRGQISCRIRLEGNQASDCFRSPNIEVGQSIQAGWQTLSKNLGLEEQMPVEFLLAFKEQLFEPVVLNLPEEIILEALDQAIKALQEMKKIEGNQLGNQLVQLLNDLEASVQLVEQQAPNVSHAYRDKLLERLKDLHIESDNNQRILLEIALFADKMDITEETVRLKSHITQFHQLLSQPIVHENQTKGKMGEFLIQELMRETNTIASKGNDLKICQVAMEMKTIIEKLKEQIQNIE